MSVGDWSLEVLCSDADIIAREATWLNWTDDTQRWIASAKDAIERKLRHAFRDRELATSATDVLDLIGNPEVLKAAAVCKAIEMCCQSNITMVGDTWEAKMKYWARGFDDEFEMALGMIAFDTDESGAIDDTEKYQVSPGPTLTRGGALPQIDETEDVDR